MRLPLSVRRFASRLIRRIPVRIRDGPNRGLRWSLAAAGRGFWAGRFEEDRIDALAALVNRGDRFWDGGAHQGYVTLLASRRVGSGGTVTALEPSRYNRWYLERHVSWNGLGNVRVLPVALSDRDGPVSFRENGSSVTFRLGEGGGRRVEARRPTTLAAELGPPTFVKLDVEGAETKLMEEVRELLPDDGVAFVALHSPGADRAARDVFSRGGFLRLPSGRLRRYRRRGDGTWPGDPDLVALGPERRGEAEALTELPFFRP